MRTKTLLIAAAALAAGIVSSQAQVYSQNVVGYANLPAPSSGINYCMACQFTVGVSNGINEVFPALPDYCTVLLWDVPSQNYFTYISDSSSGTGWDDGNYTALTTLPTIMVGQAFFLNPSAPVTNLFSGTVAVNVGTSNQMVFASSGINYLVASVVPYSGAVTNGNPTTGVGGINLGPANGTPDYTTLLLWDVPSQNYITYISDSSSGSGWDDGNYTALPTPPTVAVGQGLFINPSAAFTWTVGL